jgi:large subunit ribosomal protein L4
MHQAVVQYLANQRQGTQSTLTRAEVRGGGRKPWRQKGTGRARQGSIRSPQWTGGGVVFAPKPRDYSFKLNKKVKRIALKSALTTKVNEGKLVVIDELNLSEIKTKTMVETLKSVNAVKPLIVLEEGNNNAVLSARNIADVKTAGVNAINVYDILKYDTLVLTKAAVTKIEEVYA